MAATSGVAVFNDLVDTKSGEHHPDRRQRHLAGSTPPPIPITPSTSRSVRRCHQLRESRRGRDVGTVTVTAEDQYGNPENGSNPYLGTVNLTSTDSRIAGLPPLMRSTPATPVPTLSTNVVLETAGTQSITATDSASSTITGTSPTVTVVPGRCTTFWWPPACQPGCGRDIGHGHRHREGPLRQHRRVRSQPVPGHGRPVEHRQPARRPAVDLRFQQRRCLECTFSITSSSRRPAASRSRQPTRAPSTITGTSPQVTVVPAAVHSVHRHHQLRQSRRGGDTGHGHRHREGLSTATPPAAARTSISGTVDLSSTDGRSRGYHPRYTFVPGDAGSHVFNNVVARDRRHTSRSPQPTRFPARSRAQAQSVNVIPAAAYDFIDHHHLRQSRRGRNRGHVHRHGRR